MKKVDITNKRFGRLIAINQVKNTKPDAKWLFKCDCGKEKVIFKASVIRGFTKSCGCLHKSIITKHGQTAVSGKQHRMYICWQNLRSRCLNPKNKKYKDYAGRGIRVEWRSFQEFYNDMKTSYDRHVKQFGEKNTTIERINNDGNYSKENCRWATFLEQNHNQRPKSQYKGIPFKKLLEIGVAPPVVEESVTPVKK